jgi:hypothetical protein
MEVLYSIARDARFQRRPWRRLLRWLLGVLRATLWFIEQSSYRAFVVVAMMHDILEED